MGRFIECCCTSLYEAMEAQAGGARRVELCTDLSCGGVTPPLEMIREVRDSLSIKVNVLIRPRGGDFVYTEDEVQKTLQSIRDCRQIGVNGVVIGALLPDGDVDMPTMRRLIKEARPLEVTFHRAFDVCRDPMRAFDDVVSLGCDRLLTSGHEASAYEGRFLIGELVRKGGTIVMAGCGVRTCNIAEIERDSGAAEFHSTSHGPDGRTDRRVVSELADNSSEILS